MGQSFNTDYCLAMYIFHSFLGFVFYFILQGIKKYKLA